MIEVIAPRDLEFPGVGGPTANYMPIRDRSYVRTQILRPPPINPPSESLPFHKPLYTDFEQEGFKRT